MKYNFLRTMLLLFCSLVLLTACDKDEEETIPEPTKKDLLTAHDWRGDQVLVNDINVAAIPGVGSNAATFKTMLLSFREDNTYTASFTVSGQPQSFDGTWQFNADETRITLEMLGDFDITTLTEDNFNVAGLISSDNVDFIARIMGIDTTIISIITGGGPVRTKMQFVKS
ncbi:hypothetical protein I2I11_15135 [Pontibacter sp. 172403-2]|uniref:hypothetical protein n=1 Tax=Pontibacter rufus TaxID=2791028 RepID=UPI0018B0102D|nr:hypothetical protein [Pontibacter sp. 172403-2]MBF9254637.1 hypothetical protein [Pontibacter sp. 172403-2]